MIVVIADRRPEELLAAASRHLPPRWSLDVEVVDSMAALVAGADWRRSDRWLVAGRPSLDPWGAPGKPLPLEQAVDEFDAFGARAVHLASGPFVAVDLEAGALVRPLNGLVPVWAGEPRQRAAGTSDTLLRSLGVASPRSVPPGHVGGSSGIENIAAIAQTEHLRGVTRAGVDRERREHPLATPVPHDEVVWNGGRAPLSPGTAWHEALSARWWGDRLAERWLYAPEFERPALDLASLAGGP